MPNRKATKSAGVRLVLIASLETAIVRERMMAAATAQTAPKAVSLTVIGFEEAASKSRPRVI
jgi:hypothetical protein